jgi:hypothetical protein
LALHLNSLLLRLLPRLSELLLALPLELLEGLRNCRRWLLVSRLGTR